LPRDPPSQKAVIHSEEEAVAPEKRFPFDCS
jgi:hypothetical protein